MKPRGDSMENVSGAADKWYGESEDSDEDMVTDYMVDDEGIGRQMASSQVPVIRVTPGLDGGTGTVLEDNIQQLHYIHECVQQMRELMPPHSLHEVSRLSTSCPSLDDEGISEPDIINAGTQSLRGSSRKSNQNNRTSGDWEAYRATETVDGDEAELAKHRSCSALDDLCFGKERSKSRLQELSNRSGSISMSSLDSDREDALSEKANYLHVDSQNENAARLSLNLGKLSLAKPEPSSRLADSLSLASRPTASLQRSISTPSKISISKNLLNKTKAQSDDEVLANLLEPNKPYEVMVLSTENDLPEKRRKRGSMFFRRKKDKVKKLYSRRTHHYRGLPTLQNNKYIMADGWGKGSKVAPEAQYGYSVAGHHNHGYVSGYSEGSPLLQYEFLDEPLVTVVDLDTDPFLGLQDDEPDSWTPTVSKDVLERLSKKDIKRQEHYYEFILTEKHHCLTLRVMQKIFVEGLHKYLRFGTNVESMFPRLNDLMEIHFEFLRQLRNKQRENPVIQSLGDVLLEQFSGLPAERLKSVYGEFCSNHRNAINMYKYFMQNDTRFSEFVKHCETNPLLKKKGIPECVLFVTQRLTKYPLLIEPLIKTSKENEDEHDKLVKSLALVKEVLVDVNSQVADNEKEDRKFEIHDRIDAKSFTIYRGRKFKKSDLLARNRSLKFEGIATLMQGRGKMQVVLVLVLSDVLCFLSESNSKYSFFTPESKEGVVSLQKLLVREKAGQESRVIYLISTNPAEMFELKVHNPKHKQAWIMAIREAVQRCPDDESDGLSPFPDCDEKQKQFETKRKHVQQVSELMKQNDKQLAQILEEKMVLQMKLLAGMGVDNTSFQPNYAELVSESLNYDQIRKTVDFAIKKANQITKSLYVSTANLSRSVSSVGEHQSNAYKSPILPKRAETFSGFDSQPVNSRLTLQKNELSKSANDKNCEGRSGIKSSSEDMAFLDGGYKEASWLDNQDYQAAVTHLSHHVYTLSCIISQQMTSIDSLESELIAFKSHPGGDGRPEYRRNQQLEELRNLQDKLQSEKEVWQRQRDSELKELEQKKEELSKLQEQIKESQADIAQQREQLYRKLEALSNQGIVVGPTMIVSSPDSMPSSSSTLPSDLNKRKVDPAKWKTVPGKDNTFPRNLISATNQHKVPPTVKQQLPLKLSSRSSTGAVSPNPHGDATSPHQILPLKLREEDLTGKRAGGYQRLSSNQSPPQLPGHSRTSSSPAMMQNVTIPAKTSGSVRRQSDKRVKSPESKNESDKSRHAEEEIIYC
uniref:A-kinase anchor protein 13 n=1 Tax=Lygus hesperus TaxID=30085 RepID=A0A0A9VU05_LYGHE